MRVISGRARGTKLFAPDGLDTRPTLDRVREAIFSMIFGMTDGARVLDLFAGSGAMGVEALSRGAAECDFVDIAPAACKCIRQNLDKTRLDGASVYNTDFKSFLKKTTGEYQLIFLDPPYDSGYYNDALDMIREQNLLADDGVIVAECADADKFDCRGFDVYRQRRYGKATVFLLQRSKEGES